MLLSTGQMGYRLGAHLAIRMRRRAALSLAAVPLATFCNVRYRGHARMPIDSTRHAGTRGHNCTGWPGRRVSQRRNGPPSAWIFVHPRIKFYLPLVLFLLLLVTHVTCAIYLSSMLTASLYIIMKASSMRPEELSVFARVYTAIAEL